MQSVASLLKENPDPDGPRDPRRARGQPVPVHRLPEHRQGRTPGSAGAVRMTVTRGTPHETTLEVGRPRPTQGGSAPDHRSDPAGPTIITRARHATPRPWCAAPSRTRRSFRSTWPRRRLAPGVIAVFTGPDLADDVGPMPCGWPLSPEDKVPVYPGREEEVNFAGEIVAVVVARSAQAARDATELVDVEYEDEQVSSISRLPRVRASLRPPRLGDECLAPLDLRLGRGGNRSRMSRLRSKKLAGRHRAGADLSGSSG